MCRALLMSVPCAQCRQDAATCCQREPKECGVCCQPACNRGAQCSLKVSRGSRGNVSKETRWIFWWRSAVRMTNTLYPTSRLWKTISGFSGMSYVKVRYGYVRYPIEEEWLRPDTETKTLTETALPWLYRKSKKTCCTRTSTGNVTCRVDRGADSSLRGSGTSTTKQKRVRGSFKPSTQYTPPRRRDPPEDLVGRKLNESLLGGSIRGTTE